jgi:hypothetical protein
MRFSAPDCIGKFSVIAQFVEWGRSDTAVNGIAGESLEDRESIT